MNLLLWFRALSNDQLETLLLGALVLFGALVVAFMRETNTDQLVELRQQLPFRECYEGTGREFLHYFGSLFAIIVFFTYSWAYFSCCFDLWSYFCRLFGIPTLNLALIPALAIACVVFLRLTSMICSMLEERTED
ncbi:MAG: hypothetical protein HQM09_06095 [Candidatus Riflebacteria bacterium]|nr:hypothetical protein [Candidatus Riflebacteria bacterium]